MPPHIEMMMNSQGRCSCPEHNNSVDPGEATTGGCGGDGNSGDDEGFLGMFGDRHSSGDLFDLVWQGGFGSRSSMNNVQPSHLPSSSPAAVPPPPDDKMAAWLYPIVRGDELSFTGLDDHHSGDLASHAVAAADDQQEAAADHKREKVADQQAAGHRGEDKLPKTEDKCRAEDSKSFSLRKATGGAKKTYTTGTHNLTEKRRRCKINEKFKTLQQLVPGCDKSNQVSTLDQTIQYMKSLQQQIQAMSFRCGVKSAPAYPVVAPQYLAPPAAAARLMAPPATAAPRILPVRGHVRPGVVLAPPPAMVPFGPLLPLVNHHHEYPVAMASPPILYPAVAAPNVNVVASSSQRQTAE